MEKINKRRQPLRRQFFKLEADVLDQLRDSPEPNEVAYASYRLLCDTLSQLEKLDANAYEQLIDGTATDAEVDIELDEVQEIRKRAEILRFRVEKKFTPAPGGQSDNCGSSMVGENKRKVKLPMVEMKKFSGQLLDWLGFWAQFKKIHDDATLHDSDKFSYLMQSLEVGTEPFEIASGYPQSEENYVKVVDALLRRYGDNDILLQVYIRELLNLVICNVSSKDKVPFKTLFLKLDSHLRSLKSLNLEKADPASWLFPLVESSLPEEILYSWQRNPLSSKDGRNDDPPKNRLDFFLEFMDKEVQILQKIELTKSFAREQKVEVRSKPKIVPDKTYTKKPIQTVVGFHTGDVTCMFCNKSNHKSSDCFKAKKLPHPIKMDILKKKRACFICFGKHLARDCDSKLGCQGCGGKHHVLICDKKRKVETPDNGHQQKRSRTETPPEVNLDLSNQVQDVTVSLQTLLVKISSGGKEKIVRAFMDSGSHRSYILKHTVDELELQPKAEETVVHSLFGGAQTKAITHGNYDIKIRALDGNYQIQAEVRDQMKICGDLPRLSSTSNVLMEELVRRNVMLTDIGEAPQVIELLIGADLYGRVLTGRIVNLDCGAVAIQTKLGWTLVGQISGDSVAMTTLNMAVCDSNITKLWELDVLGIRDPIEVATAEEKERQVKNDLIKSIMREDCGRYTVQLPWKLGHPTLPSNKEVAMKRLQSTTRKLIASNLYDAYDKLFLEWESEGFIERALPLENYDQPCHYLPHRAVVKMENMTTPVRPVFDASCKVGRAPSLNDCLHKGGNLIQLIPDILLRFREKSVGFIADIRKAFLMIGVNVKDRDCLRFLWWEDTNMQNMKEYRHARIPFGATCSPFILGAVLEHHLSSLPDEHKKTGERLFLSLYVDNCCSSEDTVEEYLQFRQTAVEIMKKAGMELRLWMSSEDAPDDTSTQNVSVLGVQWDRRHDIIFVDTSKISTPEKMTKRSVLSTVQKLYDPVGFTCPVVVQMKALLQRAWVQKLKWDDPLPEEEASRFKEWCSDIKSISEIKVPRLITGGNSNRKNWSLHVFTDASLTAYAAVIYLRVEHIDKITVHLLASKSRIAPVGGSTVPRLELMGCLVGVRLAESVIKALSLEDIEIYYWCDSTTAQAWIRNNDQWGTFVGNRTAEIRRTTTPEMWWYIPSHLNPADLPSRGCSASQLIQSKFWEGPRWLYTSKENWPQSNGIVNEEEILEEKKKSCTSLAFNLSALENVKNSH